MCDAFQTDWRHPLEYAKILEYVIVSVRTHIADAVPVNEGTHEESGFCPFEWRKVTEHMYEYTKTLCTNYEWLFYILDAEDCLFQ
jgi:hypothetical protein